MPFRRGAVHLCGIARNLCCGSAAVTGGIILRHDYTIFLGMPESLAFYVLPHNCILNILNTEDKMIPGKYRPNKAQYVFCIIDLRILFLNSILLVS